MAQIYGARLKYLRFGISILQKDLNILNIPWMCGKRIKYLRKGFTMLKMIEEFDKRLICMANDVRMWEIAEIFEKRLKYV